MGRLGGKVALITSSDSGIGQGSAVEFAREGADIVVHYLQDRDGADRTRQLVEQQGRKAIVVQGDISDERQVDAIFDDAVSAFSTVDILMNNAGVDSSGKKVAEMDTETWDRAIRTNLYGPFFCCRRFIQLRQQAGGREQQVQSIPWKRAAEPREIGRLASDDADYVCGSTYTMDGGLMQNQGQSA